MLLIIYTIQANWPSRFLQSDQKFHGENVKIGLAEQQHLLKWRKRRV